ncbi:hypothetical protein FAGAP_1281 [Fusarium agapanthi]|uniref:Uncharacterized protein n=1 Tax=Fusarium agapanthi TaxID=1803897 RepID=A0A9P5BJV9_9HYPO|nr:hypothetical protein FAGAP_1281 [Fusarium agapanthi]
MDPNQSPEDREKTEDVAHLGIQRTSLSMSSNPGNAAMLQHIRGLKPFGLIDHQGNLVGLQFLNSHGGPQTNVMASSNICLGAILYKGPYQAALAHIHRHQGSYYMIRLGPSTIWTSALAAGFRSAPMTFRFLGFVNGNAKTFPELDGNAGDVVVILIPQGGPFFPNGHPSLPHNVLRPRLVMEEPSHMEFKISDVLSELPARTSDFQEAVVSGVFQASKRIMFNMLKHNSQTGPRLVSELKPVGVVDDKGVLIGVRFQNFIGDDEHVMARFESVPSACIYQGVEDGFQPAMETLFSNGTPSPIACISVPFLDKKFMTNLPAGHRKIGMQLQVVKGQLDSYGDTRTKPREAGPERAVIILPECQKLFSEVNKGMACIFLEEDPFGRSSAEPFEPLSNENVHLLETFHTHQLCAWKGDSDYLTDSFIVEFHRKIERALTQLKATAAATTTTSGGDVGTERDHAIEALRVQTDISDSLRGILETLQHRGSSCGTMAADSEDEGASSDPKTGRKRSAPNGDGRTVDDWKKPRTG